MSENALRMICKLALNNALANYRLAQATIALDQSAFEAQKSELFPLAQGHTQSHPDP